MVEIQQHSVDETHFSREVEVVVQSELMKLVKDSKTVLHRDEHGKLTTTLHNADQIIDELERRLGKSLRSKKESVIEEKKTEIIEEEKVEEKVDPPFIFPLDNDPLPESFFTQESQRVRKEWGQQKQQIESSISSLPSDDQVDIINRMLEIDTALRLAFNIGALHEAIENMKMLQEEVQQKLQKAAEEAIIGNLEAAPTVIALKKPGFIERFAGMIHSASREDKKKAKEMLRFGEFITGFALIPLLQAIGIQPEIPMVAASVLSTAMVGINAGLFTVERNSTFIEASFPKANRSIRRLTGGHSIAYLAEKIRGVVEFGFPMFTGMMAGGLLDKSLMFAADRNGIHLSQLLHHNQSGGGRGAGDPGFDSSHSNDPNVPPVEGPPRPPVTGEPISKPIFETVPTNGTTLSQQENNFLHGLFPGYEHVQAPAEYHNGVLNMLKNLDIAVSKRLGVDAANPSDGLYRLLDRIDAVKAVDVYVGAVQKLPKNWTIGQLDDPQYGLSEYQKVLLRAGAGGQYLSDAELSEVINMLEKVK